MTPADLERANSWVIEIIEALVEGVQWRIEGDERRAMNLGGLLINTRKGCWFNHTEGRGGWSVIPLIAWLKKCSYTEATAWTEAWLSSHAGSGAGITGDTDDDREIEVAIITQDILSKLVDPAETPAELYLKSRGIMGPLPDWVRYWPTARCGEGAVVGLLKSHDRVVGLQAGYIDVDGRRSVVVPHRRKFMLERSAGAVFELPASAGVTDMLADTVVAEGLEDMLSVAEIGRRWRIVGVPGIGALRHIPVKKAERIVVLRDGDDPASPAAKALVEGVDHLLLEGAVVRVTETPAGQDANSTLQSSGIDALLALISTAKRPATLSRDGEITRLSQLDPLDYEQQRKEAAERLGIRVGSLDKAVARKRTAGRLGADAESGDNIAGQGRPIELPVVEPWHDAVEIAVLLDDIVAGLKRYLVLEEHQAVATAVWVVFTHAFDAFEIAPKLVLRSAQKRSGKTRGLEVLMRLVAKPLETSGISAASLLRVIERCAPTLLLDEVDTMIRGSVEMAEALRGILNSGFNRSLARIIKSVPVPGGGWEEREFSTWCPQVLAGIGQLPDTVADRSIQLEMKRKKPAETVSRLRAKDGGELRILARQAARWAADSQIELAAADPATPAELNDRAADAWSPLFAIADAAGGEWPQRARQAAILVCGEEDTDTIETELLADIRAAFDARRKEAKSQAALKVADQFTSDDLVAKLVEMEGRSWAEINRGRPLTKHGLAHRLKPFHVIPGTIWLGSGRTAKGYRRQSFEDAFERYLASQAPNPTDSTVRSSGPAENKEFEPDFKPSGTPAPDGSEMAENDSVRAAPDDLTVENAGNGAGAQELGERTGAQPDKTELPNFGDLADLDDAIVAYAAANPGKSAAAIAKNFGQPQAVVVALLERERC